jgi:hypothetical protein
VEQYRLGYLITMCSFFLAGWTVHFWNGTYVLFLFLLGSGYWMLDVKARDRAFGGAVAPATAQRKSEAVRSGRRLNPQPPRRSTS